MHDNADYDKWVIIRLGAGGSIPTKLTGIVGPVYPIKNTKTQP